MQSFKDFLAVDYTPGMPDLVSYAAMKRKRGRIGESTQLDEATTVSRADFDKLKKGSMITIDYGSSITRSNTRTFLVKSKTRSAKYKVDKVNMVDAKSPGGMKFHLYSRQGGDATLALGDMGAVINSYSIKESVGESVNLEEALVKVTDVNFDYRDQLPNSPKTSDIGAIKYEWKQDSRALRDAVKKMGGLVTDTIAPSRGNKWVGTVTIGTRDDPSKLDDKSIQKAVKSHGIEIHSHQFRESVNLEENTIDLAREVVKKGQFKKGLDMQTANLILQVYSQVNDKVKKKMETMKPAQLGSAVWKLKIKMKNESFDLDEAMESVVEASAQSRLDRRAAKHGLGKKSDKLKKASDFFSKPPPSYSKDDLRKMGHPVESVELDELSKGTLSRYAKKASADAQDERDYAQHNTKHAQSAPSATIRNARLRSAQRANAKADQRTKGVALAKKKSQAEDVSFSTAVKKKPVSQMTPAEKEKDAKRRKSYKDFQKGMRKGFKSLSASCKNEDVTESKSSTGYDLYHKTFSGAMQHAYEWAKKQGVTVSSDDIDNKVATGPAKPKNGKTNSYILDTNKKNRRLHVQVANLDNRRYELNAYIQ